MSKISSLSRKSTLKVLQASSFVFIAAALVVSGFFVSTAHATISTLNLTSPDGSEEWRGSRNITWSGTSNNGLDTIDISYAADGSNYTQLVDENILFSGGSYSWDTSSILFTESLTARIKIAPSGFPLLGDSSTGVFTVDNTDPVTTFAIAPVSPDGLNGWYVTVPTITLSCDDGAGSGCNNTYYKWDGAALWTTYTVPFVALEGEHILSFYSDDDATNTSLVRNEETVQTETIKVDTTLPIVAVTSTTADGYYNASDTINVTLTFSEAVSSTNTLTVNLNSGGSCVVPILTNTTTGNCTYTVLGGHNSSDLTVTTIMPASGVVEDIAGNDSTLSPTSNIANTSAIVIDTTAPSAFTTGAVTITGGTVVPLWWNSTNTGLNVVVPIDSDPSLVGGTIQLTENNGGGPLNMGSAYTITGTDVTNGTKTLSLSAGEVEGVTGFAEADVLTFSAIITDIAGNATTGGDSIDTFTVDQTAPTVNAGTDKEVNAVVSQDATTSDAGSGLDTHSWTQFSGPGVLTFGTPTTVDTTISAVPDGIYVARLTVTDIAGNSASDDIDFARDTTDPNVTEVTPVPTPTNDTTPNYTFSVDSIKQLPASGGGGIVYASGCSSATVTAVAGSNTITLNALADGTYGGCTITVTDAAGNTSGALTLSSFEIDTIMAAVSSITTTDANSDGMVDTATIVFTDEMKDSTFAAGDFTIGGVAATTFTTGTANDATVTLSHSGVAGTESKTVTYTPGTVTDLAGNIRTTFTSGSIDEAKPVLLSAKTTSVTTATATFSENLNGGTVNTVIFEFTVAGTTVTGASETAPGVVTLTYAPALGTGATPLVTYTQVDTLNDLAPVPNTAVTPVSVTAVDGVAPTLSSVTISSNNDGDVLAPEWAIVGNTATLTFTSSESIATPTVLIDGMVATVTGGPTAWSATYTFVGGETDGTITLSIAFADLAVPTPNTGTTVTATGDLSSVFFDEVAPAVYAGTNKEVNALVAQVATASDSAPASGVNTYLWSQQSGPGTVTFSNPSGTGTSVNTNLSANLDGTYVLRLTATDNAGNSAYSEMTFIWDTTNPEPITSAPSDGATGVAVTAGTATVTYDEDIVLLDSGRVLLVNDETSTSYKGTVSVMLGNGNSAVLLIDYSGLAYGTKYRINVKPNALEDVAGNNLVTNFISYFTTEADTIVPVVNSANASSITTTGATLNVTTDESATCSYATTDSAYGSMTPFTTTGGTSHSVDLTGLASDTGHNYFVRCADTTAQTNTMKTSAHVSFTTLTPDTTGPVITNIQATSIGETSATITWTTDESATSRVEYGPTSSYGTFSVSDTSADNTTHSVALSGLSDGTEYHFRVISADTLTNNSTSGDNTFTTIAAVDTTAPDVPVITTSPATIDADTYTIAGTVVDDGGTRIVSLYNGTTSAGTASVPAGDIAWSIFVPLTQDDTNVFTATASDDAGNTTGASTSVTITEATATGDTDAPAIPVISGSDEGVDADIYTLSGTAGADTPSDGPRTITIYRNSITTVVGSIVLPTGETNWSLVAPLLQDATNTFTAYSTDEAGNTSAVSNSRIITEATTLDTTPPVITLLGANPLTLTEGDTYTDPGATASDDVDGDISGDISDDGVVDMDTPGTYTVTYTVYDSAGNPATQETRTVIVEAAFDDTAELKVTGIAAVKTYATDTDDFADGWSWTFSITVPTDETEFTMKFDDFVSGSNTIFAADNIRYYTAQSSEAENASEAVTIAGAGAYPGDITLDSDLYSGVAGRQIEVTVEVKVPVGSAGGSYSAQYGVKSL